MKHFLFLLAFLLLATSFICRAGVNDTVWTRYTQNIVKLQFSNDDSTIMTVGDGGLIFFNTLTGIQTQRLYDGDGEYSSDGLLIYGLRQTRDSLNNISGYTIENYNSKSYKLLKTIPIPQLAGADYARMKVSSDGQTIAIMTFNSIFFIDNETGSIKKAMNSFGNETREIRIEDMVFSKDGQDLIITMGDPVKGSYGEMMYINTQTYQMDYRNDNMPKFLALSSDGSLLAFNSFSSGNAVTIMNTQTHQIIKSIPGKASDVTGITFSPDNNYLGVSFAYNFLLNFYNLTDLKILKSYSNSSFMNIDCSKNLKYFVTNVGQYLLLFNSPWDDLSVSYSDITTDFIYPNPTTNSVSISFNLPMPSQLNFNLYDLTGKLISTLKSGFYNSGQVKENLSLSTIPAGSYFLNVESSGFDKSFKIIINN